MAPEANISSFDWDNNLDELKTALTSNNILISNHSYGKLRGWSKRCRTCSWRWYGQTSVFTANQEKEDYLFGKYNGTSNKFDELVFENPKLKIFLSAGNHRQDDPYADLNWNGNFIINSTNQIASAFTIDSSGNRQKTNQAFPADNFDNGGFDTIEGKALSKNVITIGAIHDIDPDLVQKNLSIANFSSWGPTDDGRIKPDLVANGVRLLSTEFEQDSQGTNLNNKYTTKSGTSMATPTASGIGVLIEEVFNNSVDRELFADEMKALLIHTAKNNFNGPSYKTGWGTIQADIAADIAAGNSGSLSRHSIQAGSNITIKATCEGDCGNAENRIRVTIVWIDQEGSPNTGFIDDSTPALVNDLDLSLNPPSDKEHLAWALDPTQPDNKGERTGNSLDNIEVVDVFEDENEQGVWEINITSKANEDCDFALVVSGLIVDENDSNNDDANQESNE